MVAYDTMIAPMRPLNFRDPRMALAELLNSPWCFAMRDQTSSAMIPKTSRVKTWEARPTIITLFPVLVLDPPAARIAPILDEKLLASIEEAGVARAMSCGWTYV